MEHGRHQGRSKAFSILILLVMALGVVTFGIRSGNPFRADQQRRTRHESGIRRAGKTRARIRMSRAVIPPRELPGLPQRVKTQIS